MNICRAFDAVDIHEAPSAVARAGTAARKVRKRVADAIASFLNSRSVPRLAPITPDIRTLRDIGLTPMGISEESLAALNEAGRRAGGRS